MISLRWLAAFPPQNPPQIDWYFANKRVALEYDYKTKKLSYDFADDIADEGRNDLKVVVTDNMGNSATFESHFFRSKQ